MTTLSIDFARVASSLDRPSDTSLVGAALLAALEENYEVNHSDAALYQFEYAGGQYLFDLASSASALREDRTVAAWAVTPANVRPRDLSYDRGFPMAFREGEAPTDRGHVIPYLSGGESGPTVFRQDRALNRGWSEQGKRYRALERQATDARGNLYVAHLIYTDDSAYPSELEIAVLRGAALRVERFDNQPQGH